jgi:lipoprotein NlpI
MKKFFAFALVASMMSLAACSEKKTETTSTDSTMSVDTTMATDTAMAVDTASAMSADTTKK